MSAKQADIQAGPRLLIAGRGNAARVTALALSAAGLPVTMEPRAAPHDAPDWQSVLALSPAAKTMLEKLHLWENLDCDSAEICDMRVFGSAAAIGDDFLPSRLGFAPPAAKAESRRGGLGHIVSLAALGRALHDTVSAALKAGRIELLDAPIDDFNAATQTVRLANGRAFKTELLVDCQRDAAWRQGGAAVRHDYKAKALVTAVRHADNIGNHNAGHRAGHQVGQAAQIFLPDGPLALLPLPDPQARALVWSLPAAKADALAAAPDELLAHELTRATQDRFGVLHPHGARATQSLSLYLARDFHTPHHVLVGEAAHVVHPLAGQGFNLTLRDAAALADQLHTANRLGLPLYDATLLSAYARHRRADAALMVGATHGLARLFQTRLSGLARIGMGVLGAAAKTYAPLRTGFVRQANGGAHLPRLMRGDDFEL